MDNYPPLKALDGSFFTHGQVCPHQHQYRLKEQIQEVRDSGSQVELVDSRCADLVHIIPTLEFLSQALVESQGAGFRASVIHVLGMDHETGHAGDGDNV
jgi:hypothetical protein